VIFVCDSVSCWLLRYQQILDHLRDVLGIQFGDTTADDRFTLLPIQCLGACDHAPAMVIDEDFYGDLTPQKVDTILEKYE
jgi:NADH-quinone oxidoreductase subunit E